MKLMRASLQQLSRSWKLINPLNQANVTKTITSKEPTTETTNTKHQNTTPYHKSQTQIKKENEENLR